MFLQNVHLVQTWLLTLEETLEKLHPHPNFRLFLSTEPPLDYTLPVLPESLLQSAIRISNELLPGKYNTIICVNDLLTCLFCLFVLSLSLALTP